MEPGELLIRGNFPKNSTSKLTGVVEAAYTTDSMSEPGDDTWLFFVAKATRSTWFITSARATGSGNCTWPSSASVPASRMMSFGRSRDRIPSWTSTGTNCASRSTIAWNCSTRNRIKFKSSFPPCATLNLDLADLFPPLLDVSQAPEAGQEIITQLRLLHSTVGVKLDQFDRAPHRGVLADRKFR